MKSTLGDGNPLMFPMRSGKAISASTLPKMLQQNLIPAVAHGFRSSFRDWAAEETDHPREVIEATLAHVVQNKVEAAYARSDLFERRRRLMDDWAGYLVRQVASGRLRRRERSRRAPLPGIPRSESGYRRPTNTVGGRTGDRSAVDGRFRPVAGNEKRVTI